MRIYLVVATNQVDPDVNYWMVGTGAQFAAMFNMQIFNNPELERMEWIVGNSHLAFRYHAETGGYGSRVCPVCKSTLGKMYHCAPPSPQDACAYEQAANRSEREDIWYSSQTYTTDDIPF